MAKKDPLKKLLVSTLAETFYLNVLSFKNDRRWFPAWYSKWAGSRNRSEAVKLRKEMSIYLHEYGSDDWKDGKNIKTVKVNLYQ